MKNLAMRMRELRLSAGFSQEAVAKRLDIGISTYCRYEYGEREPSAGTVAALARLYQVTSDYLLGLDSQSLTDKPCIILASNSPRRKELLAQIGLTDFKVSAPNVDETVEDGLSPAQIVEELSRRKAGAAAHRAGPDDVIIAADTVVAVDGQVLGKPKGEAGAFDMLKKLSGREHQVYTGVTVLRGGKAVTEHEETAVTFRALSDGEIWGYIATGEPMDKAGAYGIQGVGALLVSGIRGDYANVVGLPVFRLGRMLAGFGVELLAPKAQ